MDPVPYSIGVAARSPRREQGPPLFFPLFNGNRRPIPEAMLLEKDPMPKFENGNPAGPGRPHGRRRPRVRRP